MNTSEAEKTYLVQNGSGTGTSSIDRGSHKSKRLDFVGLGKENCICVGYWFCTVE